MSDLLVIVPSRGRPKSIARMLDSVHETRMAGTHLHVCVDEDDPELASYGRVMEQAGQDGDVLETGPRKGLAAWTNVIAVRRAREYPYLASLGDDMVPRTLGWDKALIRGITDMGGTGFTYPWDGMREDIPEAVVLSSDIVIALGWMCGPTSHWYVDDIWADLGRGAGCLRHLRVISVKHEWKADQTAKESGEKITADRDAYYRWRREPVTEDGRSQMAVDIGKIIVLREARAESAKAALQPA
jgi:hypothetical protein